MARRVATVDYSFDIETIKKATKTCIPTCVCGVVCYSVIQLWLLVNVTFVD